VFSCSEGALAGWPIAQAIHQAATGEVVITLTEKETYAQLVCALDRMHCKELICDSFRCSDYGDSGVCAGVALSLHTLNEGAITGPLWAVESGTFNYRWHYPAIGTSIENDRFMRRDNSPKALKARWKHMRTWAEGRAQ
jgi:hypothetical protein